MESTHPAPGSLSDSTQRLLLGQVEDLLITFVRVFDERLAFYLELAGEEVLTRRYTEKEFRDLVVDRVQELFLGRIAGIVITIHPDGFQGTGWMFTESGAVEVKVRLGLAAMNGRPHVQIGEISLGSQAVGKEALILLEEQVNKKIDQSRLILKIQWIELNEGWAVLSVARKR